MMAINMTTNPMPPAALHELKSWLRIDTNAEDALLFAQIRAAVDMAGRFMGQPMLATDCAEEMPATTGWNRLGVGGVLSITNALVDGAPLPPAAWEMDIDRHGVGWVRVSATAPVTANRVRILYRAGLAVNWDAVPEALRQGVIRYAAHLYATRDTADADPPAAVTAFWRPWKQVRL
jgi:uncharacterized phiE125 gp8 family phage protein